MFARAWYTTRIFDTYLYVPLTLLAEGFCFQNLSQDGLLSGPQTRMEHLVEISLLSVDLEAMALCTIPLMRLRGAQVRAVSAKIYEQDHG